MKIIRNAVTNRTIFGFDPTSVDRWEACPGKCEAVDILRLPQLGNGSSGWAAETGLCTHSILHGMNHDLLDTGVSTSKEAAIERTLRGFAFRSKEGETRALRDLDGLVRQYLYWRTDAGYRLEAAELNVATSARQVPGHPNLWWYLTGRVDFLGWRADGTPCVTDYKTGEMLLTRDQLATRLSSAIYALLAAHHFRRSRGHFQEAVEVGVLYLRSGHHTAATITQSTMDNATLRFDEIAAAIAKGEITYVAGNHCSGCPAMSSCEAFLGANQLPKTPERA
jgi:PD-(D/E)XK nuclease superfamily